MIGGRGRRTLRDALGAKLALLLACLFLVALASCSSGSSPKASTSPSPTQPAFQRPVTVTITVTSAGFQPPSLVAAPGTNVIWIQADKTPNAQHAIASGSSGHPDGKFSSPALKDGASFTVVLRTAGTYPYYDRLHPQLSGQFVVSAVGPSPPAGPVR